MNGTTTTFAEADYKDTIQCIPSDTTNKTIPITTEMHSIFLETKKTGFFKYSAYWKWHLKVCNSKRFKERAWTLQVRIKHNEPRTTNYSRKTRNNKANDNDKTTSATATNTTTNNNVDNFDGTEGCDATYLWLVLMVVVVEVLMVVAVVIKL